MSTAASILVGLIAVEHVYILVMEMFLWNTPTGHRAFELTPAKAELTAPMAINQGLYNGFLAAGLAWSLAVGAGWLGGGPVEAYHLQIFFTGCVAVAGVVGGATAMRKIFFLQALPGIAALAAVLAAGPH
jgi:putative membrane protein